MSLDNLLVNGWGPNGIPATQLGQPNGAAPLSSGGAVLSETPGLSNSAALGFLALGSGAATADATAVGQATLRNLTSGVANTAVGNQAGFTLTTGIHNVFVGYNSGLYANTGTSVGVGSLSLDQAGSGIDNTGVGYQALGGVQGSYNTGVGRETMANINHANYCVAIGWETMGWPGGDNNTASGTYAMFGQAEGVLTTSALSTGGPITSLPVQALPIAITAGDNITVRSTTGARTDTFVASGAAIVGATAIPVNSQTPTYAFESGSFVTDTGPGSNWANTFQFNTATGFKAMAKNPSSNGGGLSTGSYNVAAGAIALGAISTGSGNVAMGYNALNSLTTGSNNTGMGIAALGAIVTGVSNVGIGADVMASATSSNNTAVGYFAGYQPNGVAGNATVAGAQQTLYGYQTGQGSATQRTGILAVGYQALCDGDYSSALGYKASAGAAGAVAIGADSGGIGASTTIANNIKLGTANHSYTLTGLPSRAFVASDKYVVCDASGNLHISSLGPAS